MPPRKSKVIGAKTRIDDVITQNNEPELFPIILILKNMILISLRYMISLVSRVGCRVRRNNTYMLFGFSFYLKNQRK